MWLEFCGEVGRSSERIRQNFGFPWNKDLDGKYGKENGITCPTFEQSSREMICMKWNRFKSQGNNNASMLSAYYKIVFLLTYWGRVTRICVSKLNIIGSDNGLSPCLHQAGILLIGPLGTNFSEILIEIHTYSFMKMLLKTSSAKCLPFHLGLNVLKYSSLDLDDLLVWMR